MHQTNVSFMVTFVVVALLLSGCSGSKTQQSSLPELYVGVEGVNAFFTSDSVPGVVTSGATTNLALLLKNKGTYDVALADSDIIVTLRDTWAGFDFGKDSVIEGGEIAQRLKLDKPVMQGKATTYGTGFLDALKLAETKAKDLGDTRKLETGFLATVCYKYRTDFTANVCIDTVPYTFQKVRKACDVKAPLVFTSQGAPVAIIRIEELDPDREGNIIRPNFKIFIRNAGNGLVIDQDKLDMFCTSKGSSAKDSRLTGKVSIAAELNNEKLVCTPDFVLGSRPENNYVVCSYPKSSSNIFTENSGTFATPLKIGLSYGYTATSAPVPVTVEKNIFKEKPSSPAQPQAQTATTPPSQPAPATTSPSPASAPASSSPPAASPATPAPPPTPGLPP